MDELKRKAKIVAAGKQRKKKIGGNGEIISDTDSVISDAVSESGFSVSSKSSAPLSVKSMSSASSASTTMPFLTFTKQPKVRPQVASKSERGDSPKATERLVDFKVEEKTERKKSYSPVTRSKPLSPTDPMEVYVERMQEMAAEMEDALEYMHSV